MGAVGPAPLIYPMFMTDGWFVQSALPRRLGQGGHSILPPLGVDPRLPALVAQVLRGHMRDRQWDAAATTLLVAAHGSGRSEAPKRDTETFVQALMRQLPFANALTGYVEQDPRLADAARAATGQALCLPFFAALGGHVEDDIPAALNAAGFAGACLAPVGTFRGIPGLIADCARNTAEQVTT